MIETTIQTLGQRGEGTAEVNGHRVFVPFTLPGERVGVDTDGERGQLVASSRPVPTASPRSVPISAPAAAAACSMSGRPPMPPSSMAWWSLL